MMSLAAGFVIGALWLVAVRFAAFEDTRVHHHANFALYINGQQEKFESSTFYEETQSCSADEIGPKQRVHLHDQKPEVAHVHDEGSTWGHLFANLGYGLTNELVQTDAGIFADGQNDNDLKFILNGQPVAGIANETIRSEDVLLINYGKDDQGVLQSRYDQIVRNAAEYNLKDDPSACSGSKPITFTERLKKAIGIGE